MSEASPIMSRLAVLNVNSDAHANLVAACSLRSQAAMLLSNAQSNITIESTNKSPSRKGMEVPLVLSSLSVGKLVLIIYILL